MSALGFEPAGHLLRMIAVNPSAKRKVRWTAEDEIKEFVVPKRTGIAKVTVANLVARFEAVITGGLSGQPHAFLLCLDGDEAGAGQSPCCDHTD